MFAERITGTQGWVSEVNPDNAIPGKPVESDPAAKARQTISTARPSKTVLQGLTGGVAEIPNVQRYKAYENDTGMTDANGIPEHSVCYIVEGLFFLPFSETSLTCTPMDGIMNMNVIINLVVGGVNVGKSNGYRVIYAVAVMRKLVAILYLYYKKETATVADSDIRNMLNSFIADNISDDMEGSE